MKRVLLISIILSLVLSFAACTERITTYKNPVTFYYRSEDITYGELSTVIQSEIRESKGYADDEQSIIEQYLNGPQTKGFISPFPAGTTVESFSIDGNKIQITLSPHLAILNGADLMIACACLTKTVADLTGTNTVQIRADGCMLNNQESITMTADSFICIDESLG